MNCKTALFGDNGKLPRCLKVDIGRPDWDCLIRSLDQNPTATGVKVLLLDTTPDQYFCSDTFFPYLKHKLSKHQADQSPEGEDNESVILRYLVSALPNLTQLDLRLSGVDDASYFTRINETPLYSLKILRIQYTWSQHSLSFSTCFGIFSAAPNLEDVTVMDCSTSPRMMYEGLSLPNVKTLRLVNTTCFKSDAELLDQSCFVQNNCLKLCVVECSFKFDSGVDPDLLATPFDIVVALQPVATQLQRLALTVGTGSLPHNHDRIVSLAGFHDLRVVSIAIEFIEDLSLFVQLLPRSVCKLLLHVGRANVYTFLLTGMGQVIHVE